MLLVSVWITVVNGLFMAVVLQEAICLFVCDLIDCLSPSRVQ